MEQVADDRARGSSATAPIRHGRLGGLIGALLCLAAAAVFAYQFYMWLKTGAWVSMPVHVLLSWFGFDPSSVSNIGWKGVQQVVLWLLDLPLSLVFVFFAFAVVSFLPVIFGARTNAV